MGVVGGSFPTSEVIRPVGSRSGLRNRAACNKRSTCVQSTSDASKSGAFKDALVSGSSASVLSAAVLSLCSKWEEGSAAGALNGPSQWVWGEREAHTREASLRHTFVGYTIHHAMSICWAVCYEHCFGRSCERDLKQVPVAQIAAEAATMTVMAYVVDYTVTPKRFRPGFKKHVGPASMFASYAAFAAGLAITTLVRRKIVMRAAAPSIRVRSVSAAASSSRHPTSDLRVDAASATRPPSPFVES